MSEADPDKWPGNGVQPSSWDQQTHGDRYWMKKNAATTLTIIMKTANLVGVVQQRSAGGEQGGAAVGEESRKRIASTPGSRRPRRRPPGC